MLRELLCAAVGHPGDLVHASRDAWSVDAEVSLAPADKAAASQLLRIGALNAELRGVAEGATQGQATDGWLYAEVIWDGVLDACSEVESEVLELYSSAKVTGAEGLTCAAARLSAAGTEERLTALTELARVVAERPEAALPTLEQFARRRRWGPAARALSDLLRRCSMLLLRHVADWIVWQQLPPQQGFFLAPAGEDGTCGQTQAAGLLRQCLPCAVTAGLAGQIARAGECGAMLRAASGCNEDALVVMSDAAAVHSCIASEELLLPDGGVDANALENVTRAASELMGVRLWRVCRETLPLRQLLDYVGDYFLCFRGDVWRPYVAVSSKLVAAFIRSALRSPSLVLRDALGRLRRQLSEGFNDADGGGSRKRAEAAGLRPRFSAALPAHGHDDRRLLADIEQAREAVAGGKAEFATKFAQIFLQLASGTAVGVEVPTALGEILTAECFAVLRRTHGNVALLLHVDAALTGSWRTLNHTARLVERMQLPPAAQPGRVLLRGLLAVRRRMQYFVSNLKFFILTDVLHARYRALCTALLQPDNTRTFDSARTFAAGCLERMIAEAFGEASRSKPVVAIIQQALSRCLQLWAVIQDSLGTVERPADIPQALVRLSGHATIAQELGARFDEQTLQLYTVLRRNPELLRYKQLLDRLDFNRHFSRLSAEQADSHR
eukprot:Hpha_TRINITY_DN29799_c0_g1::TRINITY_DN29799_c0_g1_i1::g.2603::m.2603/K16571/TUBGCP4, GCP4; gamma-tubulin complex component 4